MKPSFYDIWRLFVTLVFSILESGYRWVIPQRRKEIGGKLVLVTGAGRGIGREIALAFSRKGARLALCDINLKNCEGVASEIQELGWEAIAYRCDVSQPEDVRRLASDIEKKQGIVDILINNAGVVNVKPMLELRDEEIRKTMDVNVMAHFWTLRAFLPGMMERKEGHVVSIASVAGKAGTRYLTDYAASKFAAVGLNESIERELSYEGFERIYFTQVCPFIVNTPLIHDIKHRVSWDLGLEKQELEAQDVAEATLDGTLRNQRLVYIPRNFGFLLLLGRLLPYRFVDKLEKVLGVGFYQRRKSN